MANWMLQRITDYWESRSNAILTMAQKLEVLDRQRRTPMLSDIAACVDRHLDALSRSQLEIVAWTMVDDLYRGLGRLTYWDDSISDYLSASAAVACRRLTALGYSIRYFVDNDFDQTDVGLAGPALWYGPWFRAAGFTYICPQEIAVHRSTAGSSPSDGWSSRLRDDLAQARHVAADVLRACRNTGSHFVYLDAQSVPGALELANEDADSAGAILVIRNEAPQNSSRCMVKITPPIAA